MCARSTLRAGTAALQGGQLLADVAAGMLASRAAAHQRLPCLEHERLDLLSANAQDGGDLLLRVVAELEQHQRGPLVGGQPLHVVEHLAEVLAPLDLVGEALVERRVGERRMVHADGLPAGAQLRQAAVAGDGVEPWPQGDAAVTSLQGAVGGDERQLQGILGRLAVAEHVHAEGEDPAGVAVVDLLERIAVAGAHTGHQQLVVVTEHALAVRPLTGPQDGCSCPHMHSLSHSAVRVQSGPCHAFARIRQRCAASPTPRRRPGGPSWPPGRCAPTTITSGSGAARPR